MKLTAILSSGLAGLAAAGAASSSSTYSFAPEAADTIFGGQIPILYFPNQTQSNSIGGSWWASSFITTKDNEQFLVLSHVLSMGTSSFFRASTLDLKTLEYFQFVSPGDSIKNTTALDLEFSGGGIQSSAADSVSTMNAYSTSENITFDLSWNATSHAMINAGSGKFTFGSGVAVEWGLPSCRTEGTITGKDGRVYEVDSDNSFTWYDRQWSESGFVTGNWTWFELHIPQTSYKLSVWIIDNPDSNQVARFATIRGEDDQLRVVPVEFEANYTRTYRSTAADIIYPLDWSLEVGGFGNFQISSIVADQEIVGNTSMQTAYEGFITFDGELGSEKVEGFGLVEIVINSW